MQIKNSDKYGVLAYNYTVFTNPIRFRDKKLSLIKYYMTNHFYDKQGNLLVVKESDFKSAMGRIKKCKTGYFFNPKDLDIPCYLLTRHNKIRKTHIRSAIFYKMIGSIILSINPKVNIDVNLNMDATESLVGENSRLKHSVLRPVEAEAYYSQDKNIFKPYNLTIDQVNNLADDHKEAFYGLTSDDFDAMTDVQFIETDNKSGMNLDNVVWYNEETGEYNE